MLGYEGYVAECIQTILVVAGGHGVEIIQLSHASLWGPLELGEGAW